MGPEGGDQRTGRPWEIENSGFEEIMDDLEEIGISRHMINLDYGGDPTNYPENPSPMPEPKRSEYIATYMTSDNTDDDIDEDKMSEEEMYGMKIEDAKNNPKMALDQAERIITAFENSEVVDIPEEETTGFHQKPKVKLISSFLLMKFVRNEIRKEPELHQRYKTLIERRDALRNKNLI